MSAPVHYCASYACDLINSPPFVKRRVQPPIHRSQTLPSSGLDRQTHHGDESGKHECSGYVDGNLGICGRSLNGDDRCAEPSNAVEERGDSGARAAVGSWESFCEKTGGSALSEKMIMIMTKQNRFTHQGCKRIKRRT